MRVRVAIAGANGELQRTPEFNKAEITIGRRPNNDVVLPDAGASSAHARVLVTGGALTILDLDSTNGTFVNDEPVQGPRILQQDDVVQIGDFRLRFRLEDVDPEDVVADSSPPANARPAPRAAEGGDWPAPPPMMDELAAPLESSPTIASHASAPPVRSALFPPLQPSEPPQPDVSGPTAPGAGVGFELHGSTPSLLVDRAFASVWLRLRDMIATATAGAREQVRDALEQALRAAAAAGSIGDIAPLHRRMVEEMVGDGPIPSLLEGHPDEIVVVGVTRVRINRSGHVSEGPSPFTCPSALEAWVSRVCRVDFQARNPIARGTFGDYAVHAIHEPRGAVVSLRRRTPAGAVTLEALVHNGILSPGMAKLLGACVMSRQNVLLCAGAGATTRHVMAGLLACAPPQELQVVLCNPVIDVGAFPTSSVMLTRTGAGESALEAALALGPDRLAVDEVQWNEAATVVGLVSRSIAQMLGVRAGSAGLGLDQLESMLGSALAPDAARRMLMRSVDVIVALQLFSDGVARVVQVAEPVLDEGGRLGAQDIFTLVPGSRTWQWSGVQPRCFQDLLRRGFPIDASIFS